MKQLSVKLKNDGSVVNGDLFDEIDFKEFKDIFNEIIKIGVRLKEYKGRTINIPDIISEGIFCYLFNAVRTNGKASSYDCVDIKTGEGIQVKSASISSDCSSFGPTSTWDKLYFMDFAPNGIIDGNIDIYLIEKDISNIIVCAKNNETFADQQRQKRRPRFSIKEKIIIPDKLMPIKKINLLEK